MKISPAREAAWRTLARHESKGGSLREVLEGIFRGTPGLADRDRAFCRDLVYGAVRRRNTLDWALQRFTDAAVHRWTPGVRSALRLGAYQLLYLSDRVPAYAALNESVEMAKAGGPTRGAAFVNGVLRALERGRASLPWPPGEDAEALALRHSHPAWLVRRWLDRWGPDQCRAFLEKDNETPPLVLRVNTLRRTREELLGALRAEGVEAEPSPVSPDGVRLAAFPSLTELKAFQSGWFMVQDDAAQLVTDALDPQPGETVLDLCAAPGGKSTHAAQRMQNRGQVLAWDLRPDRVKLLKENCARLGVSIVKAFSQDAREAGKKHKVRADRVLVDAPCSGLGILRRRPDLRWNKRPSDLLAALPRLQREILDGAARCVKPGGVLVYAVCSVEPEENEGVLKEFLAARTDHRIEPLSPLARGPLADALTPEGCLRLLPHKHDTDGFFIARLRRAA